MRNAPSGWRLGLAAALAAAIAALFVALPGSAGAAPSGSGATDDEGGSKTLREALESAASGYVQAKARLDGSKKRQLQLTLELKQAQDKLIALNGTVAELAVEAYRSGRVGATAALLNSASPDSFLERAVQVDLMARRNNKQLHKWREAREQTATAKAAIDAEVANQQRQLKIMAKRKKDAEKALALVGGKATGGFVSTTSTLAKPAKRNADGSWPTERCIVDDPTTSGCITARTLHAMQQAKAAGFKRYVACFRTQSTGEHPKGRACDFSAAKNAFENRAATGGDRTYGNNLAAFFVRNADRLGVMYVIWYRQIWFPGRGWSSYSGKGGPAGEHTNHVHLSML